MKKKLLAFALAASMVVTCAPAAPAGTVKAADTTTPALDYVAQGNSYLNPFAGQDTSKGVEISFKVTKTGSAAPSLFATLIAFSGATAGKLFLNEGTYLGFNPQNGKEEWFDANRNGDNVVQDYLGEGTSTVKLIFKKSGYEVNVNGKKAYDQTILQDAAKASKGAEFTDSSYSTLLSFLSSAQTLDFGKGSFWAGAPNAQITDFVAKCDGEVLDLDKIEATRSYAKLPSFEGKDFTNGVTLTADVSVGGWTSDWTPLFMIGDGSVGNPESKGAYHFTQGFSSMGGYETDHVGYFGNEISSPYTWDYFSNTANQNTWNNLTMTISATDMTTYINGVMVQTAKGDYTTILNVFKNGTGNYLGGGSYWTADPDFLGSMDNVAVFNKALTADEVKAMAMSAPSTDKAGSDLSKVAADATVCKYTFDTDAGDLELQAGCKVENGALVFSEAPVNGRPMIMITDITADAGTKAVEVMTSVPNCTVKVKIGTAAYKNAKKVDAHNYKFTTSKVLTPGTKVMARVEKSGYASTWQDVTVSKLSLSVSGVKYKSNKITGSINTTGAKVQVKIGSAKFKKATVKGSKFTINAKSIKAGKKAKKVTVKIKVSHKYAKKTITKSVKVKVPAKKAAKKTSKKK